MAEEQEQSDDDKPFEPTQKRLDEARRKGEVPMSADLTNAAALAGMLIAVFGLGAGLLLEAGETLAWPLGHAEAFRDVAFTGLGGPVIGAMIQALSGPILPYFLLPAVLALVALAAQRAIVIAPERIAPKLSRISPIQGLKNKFGRNGLFEFAKSFVKLIVISAALALFILSRLDPMLASVALPVGGSIALMFRLLAEFVLLVFVITLVIGGVDLIWQQAEHTRKHRMSRKDLEDETKESEGDPWLKSRRRDRGVEIATNRMLADVPQADVVIVNPTHYAVALRWSRSPGAAPVCVAKGADEVARRIRETAMEAGVPIHRDPPTARALFELVRIGDEIAPDQYRAVAVAIRFAEAVRRRRPRRNRDR